MIIAAQRRRKVDLLELDRAVTIAQRTSVCNAERATNISRPTIREEMKRRGIPFRRPGNFTTEEINKMGAMFAP